MIEARQTIGGPYHLGRNMPTNKPPVRHRMLSRCDVCGRKTHRGDLVLQSQETREVAGNNYFTYSSYSSSGWACSATDAGATSYGTGCGLYMNTPGLSHTTMEQPTLLGGVQTWTGNGTYRATVAVNASTATNLCVSAYVGAKQDNSSPSMTVAMGFCNSSGTVLTTERTWTITGSTRVWFTTPVSSITAATTSALYVYFTVTNAGSWWINEAQFELDATRPGEFVETTGAAKTSTGSRVYHSKRVCRQCRYKKWELERGTVSVEPPDRWETWAL